MRRLQRLIRTVLSEVTAMKKYNIPEIEIVPIRELDVISCSFGELEELPASGNTPDMSLDQNIWEWN